MKFAVDAWDPGYGSAFDAAELPASNAEIRVDSEYPIDQWRPLTPPTLAAPPPLLFVDGVQRVEARVWVPGSELGQEHQGICASYAAGAVRCNGRAELVAAEVRRALFCAAPGAQPIATRHGEFRLVAAAGDSYEALAPVIRQKMGDLEVLVAQAAADPDELVIVDGPLRQHRLLANAVGYVKSHHAGYGPAEVAATAAGLAAGQRTPLFLVSDLFSRWSWYFKLPCAPSHPMAGVVRCEANAELPVAAAAAIADRVTAALPRFASRPHKDTRAPQNLYPIGGLERMLRRRLGDAALLHRALLVAAANAAGR